MDINYFCGVCDQPIITTRGLCPGEKEDEVLKAVARLIHPPVCPGSK